MERGPEEVAALVAREDPPGSIATVRGGGESQDQDACLWVAEARQRPRPVALAAISARGRRRDRLAMAHQAWTEPAPDDPPLEGRQLISPPLVLSAGLADNHPGMIAIGAEP